MILGTILLYRSYKGIRKGILYKYESKKIWIIYSLNTLFSCLLGIIAITSRSSVRMEYVIAVGSYLILNSIVELLKVFDNYALVSLRKKQNSLN